MKRSLAALAIAALGTVALAQELDREATATAEVTRYVEDWAANLPPKFRRRALAQVSSVAQWSARYEIDPLLVAVLVSLESSWRVDARGKVGEIGLLQIHPRNRRALEGADMSTGNGQIEAGVKWLRFCVEQCGGDLRRGLNAYATGHCSPEWRGLAYRWRLYQKAVKRFRVTASQQGGSQ